MSENVDLKNNYIRIGAMQVKRDHDPLKRTRICHDQHQLDARGQTVHLCNRNTRTCDHWDGAARDHTNQN